MPARRLGTATVPVSRDAFTEWCTPEYDGDREVLPLVRRSFGGGRVPGIDLDPCSNERSTVGAAVAWTSGGLAASWRARGRVFANPPWGDGLPLWIAKAVGEFTAIKGPCRADGLQLLVPANTETAWAQRILQSCDAYCLRRGRISFVGADGRQQKNPDAANLWAYYGDESAWWAADFERAREGAVFAPQQGWRLRNGGR